MRTVNKYFIFNKTPIIIPIVTMDIYENNEYKRTLEFDSESKEYLRNFNKQITLTNE